MHWGDRAQQPAPDQPSGRRERLRPWKRWARSTELVSAAVGPVDPLSAESLDVHEALRVLPTLLDSSSLPNGVVELVIEDFEAHTRQLFDIHDGHVTLVEPGTTVPWASIAGPPTAWAMALGPERNVNELQLTGDERLAVRVLAALPSRDCD